MMIQNKPKIRLFFWFFFIVSLIVVLSGCSSGQESGKQSSGLDSGQANEQTKEESAKTLTFTDTSGKTMTVDLPLQRVVVINRNTAEAIKLLGAGDRIVATGDTTIKNNPYLGFQSLPDVGETGQVNLETILSLKPQVVFAFTNRPDQKLEEKLEPAGIKVVRINNYLPDQMDTELELLGRLFGKEERAAQFLDWKRRIESVVAERVKDIDEKDKKSVLALSAGFLNSKGGYRIFPSQSLGGKPGVGEGYATILAGGRDASDLQWNPAETSTTVMVDEEYVLKRNPDIITLHGTWLGGYDVSDNKPFEEALANIMNISSLGKLSAGKNQEIYFFHTNFIGSDKRYIGTLQLAKILYPDRFQDVNPDQYAKEYYETWLGVPYKGVWYYSFKESK